MSRLNVILLSPILIILAVSIVSSTARGQGPDPSLQRDLIAGDFRCNGVQTDGGTLIQLQMSFQGTQVISPQGFHLRRDSEPGDPSICRELAMELGAKAVSWRCTTSPVRRSSSGQIILGMVCERDRNGLVHVLGELSREFITMPIQ
jgi:hypothetical protein